MEMDAEVRCAPRCGVKPESPGRDCLSAFAFTGAYFSPKYIRLQFGRFSLPASLFIDRQLTLVMGGEETRFLKGFVMGGFCCGGDSRALFKLYNKKQAYILCVDLLFAGTEEFS